MELDAIPTAMQRRSAALFRDARNADQFSLSGVWDSLSCARLDNRDGAARCTFERAQIVFGFPRGFGGRHRRSTALQARRMKLKHVELAGLAQVHAGIAGGACT